METADFIPSDDQLAGRVTLPLAITAFAAVLGGSFPHGFQTGVINIPEKLIKAFLNGTYYERTGDPPGKWMLNFLWSFTVAVYLAGGMFGAFSAGWLANKWGRKKAIIVMYIPGFVSAFLFGFCDLARSFEMIIFARVIVGFACGAGSGLVPMYMTEIAPINIRGAMGVLHQLALTIGILVSQVMGLRQLLGNDWGWPFLLAFTAVPCLISLCILPFFPDSPRYMLTQQNKPQEAEAALKRFRGEEDVSADMAEMRNEHKQMLNEPAWSLNRLFKSRHHRMPLAIVCVLAIAQQLSGINVVFYYSTDVFRAAGIAEDNLQYATLGTGTINVIMTVISVPLMEKSGRRPLLLGGMILMLISAIVITIALNLQSTVEWMAYITIACTILFVIGFAIGLGSIPQFIGGELFKQGPRPAAMSLAGFFNWTANTLVALCYPSMAASMGPFSFIIFIVLLVGFTAFLWKFLPETKNKSYEEIAAIFHITKSDEDPEADENMKVGERLSLHGPEKDYKRVPGEEPNVNGAPAAAEPLIKGSEPNDVELHTIA